MKKYMDFLRIEVSRKELLYQANCVGFNNPNEVNFTLYSKIVVQFNTEIDFLRCINDDPDINTYVLCSDIEEYKYQLIVYTLIDSAFEDICNLCSNYDCDVYQLIIENDEDALDFFDLDEDN